MRIRTIKPEFWGDEKIGKLSRNARLLFIGLWSIADDFGVARSNLSWINAQLFPYDHLSIKNLRTWLNELLNLGVIEEFSSNGETYFNIKRFRNHQVVNRPSKFRNPSPPTLIEDSVSTHGEITAGIGIGYGYGKGGVMVMEGEGECEGKGEKPKVKTLSLSKEENQDQSQKPKLRKTFWPEEALTEEERIERSKEKEAHQAKLKLQVDEFRRQGVIK